MGPRKSYHHLVVFAKMQWGKADNCQYMKNDEKDYSGYVCRRLIPLNRLSLTSNILPVV